MQFLFPFPILEKVNVSEQKYKTAETLITLSETIVHLLTALSMSDKQHYAYERLKGINEFSHWINIWNYTAEFCKFFSSFPRKDRCEIKIYVPVSTSILNTLIPCRPHLLHCLDLS